MKILYIGLGKMGWNMVVRLCKKGYHVRAYDADPGVRGEARRAGIEVVNSIRELAEPIRSRRIVWIMAPHKAVDGVLAELTKYLRPRDIVIDGGNSFYKDSVLRAKKLDAKGICFFDVGVSGGPLGAKNGASLMIGGDKRTFRGLQPLFRDLSVPRGYAHVGRSGAGHFVKMVHNGIEYGMMQALAEGFGVLRKSKYKLDLRNIARVYDHGSVIESRLVGWLEEAFGLYGEGLQGVNGSVPHTGEGEWTIKTAKKLGVPVRVIEDAFDFRVRSKKVPSYVGKILSALRGQFGGHSTK